MTTLRLLLFSACNRSCVGCCNKDWDLDALPKVKNYRGYDEIILTGGEPMLNPGLVIETASQIRLQTHAPIILYTAKPERLPEVMPYLDGVTVTLHEPDDVAPFLTLPNPLLGAGFYRHCTKRLNVFAGVDVPDIYGWEIKRGIEWIKDCPLPDQEVFMRL